MKVRRIQTAVAAVLLAGTVVLFSGNTARAQQTEALKANIPFGFYAGDKQLPPGQYEVLPVGSNAVRLTRAGTYESVVFFVIGAKNSKDSSSRIIFHAFGNEKYLSELWWGQKGSIELPSARERELEIAAAHSDIRVALSAARR